ncbi:hypothetical protein Tco_1037641, partial [Tanacetum coccineum]
VEAVEDAIENESHLIPYFIGNGLCALAMLTKMKCCGNGGRGGSRSMISASGGGLFSIRSIDSNDGRGGRFVDLEGSSSKVSKNVSGGGVTLGVLSGSIGEVDYGANGVLGGDSRGVDEGATL